MTGSEQRGARLDEVLRLVRGEIIEAWTARVQELTAARRLSRGALIDHLPEILDDIADAVERTGRGDVPPRPQSPGTHARDRLGRGYALEDVIAEYALLRGAILEVCERHAAAGIHPAELRVAHQAIDDAITRTASQYAHAREHTLRSLDLISESALAGGELSDILGRLLQALVDGMEAADVAIVHVRDGEVLRPRATAGFADGGAMAPPFAMGEGLAGGIAADARPRLLAGTAESPVLDRELALTEGVRVLYGVPLMFAGEVIGVAQMGSRSAPAFSSEDLLLFRTMASRASLMVQNALLASRDHALDAAARAFSNASTFDEAIGRLLAELGAALHWDVGCFWRVDPASLRLSLDRIWTAPGVEVPAFEQSSRACHFARGEGLPGHAWEHGASVHVPAFAADPRFPRRDAAAAEGLTTAMAFPVAAGTVFVGVVELLSRHEHSAAAEAVYLTRLLPGHLGQFTGRILAQEEMRRRSAQNAAIFEAALDCIVSMNDEGVVVGWNAAAERTFGYPRDEALGRDMAELIIPAELRAAHRAGLRRYFSTRQATILDRRIEVTARGRDGVEFPVELTITRLPAEDPPVFTGFVRDISERRRAESQAAQLVAEVRRAETAQRFLSETTKALAESLELDATVAKLARLAVPALADWCIVDLLDDGAMRRVSAAHVEPGKVELLDHLASNYPLAVERHAGVDGAVRASAPQLVPEVTDASLPALALDPALRALAPRSYLVAPIMSRGLPMGAITLATAGSDRRYGPDDVRLAEELAIRAATAVENALLFREVRAAVRLRDDVLGIVSHDLRSPLGAIKLSTEFLAEETEADPRSNKRVDSIRRATTRMDRLIGDLLDMASIRAGRLSVDLQIVELEPLLMEAFEAHEPLASDAGLHLHHELVMPGVRVRCDHERVLQALSNLIGNAIKFCAPGGSIRLQARATGREAVVSVADTGPGIPPEELDKLFEPYWTATRQGKRSTGLGLFITKGIVEAHGGRVWVESTLHVGTTFHFTVPIASRPRAEVTDPADA